MAEYLIDDVLMTAMANQIRRINNTEKSYNAAQIVDALQTLNNTTGEHTVTFIGPGETTVYEQNYKAGDICAIPTDLNIPNDYTLTKFISSPEVNISKGYFIVPDNNVNLEIQYNTEDNATFFEYTIPANSPVSIYLPTLDKYDSITWQCYDTSSSEWHEYFGDDKYNNKTEYYGGFDYVSWEQQIRAKVQGCTSIGKVRDSLDELTAIKLSTEIQTISFQSSHFYYPTKLHTLIMPPNGLTSLGQRAIVSSNLTTVILPEGLQTISADAFVNNSVLTTIYIPSTTTNIANGALSSTPVNNLIISPRNTKYHTNGTCIIETATKTLIATGSNCIIPTDGTVTTFASECFGYGMTSITIPKSITQIQSYAFVQCTSLTSAIYEGTAEEWAANVTVEYGNDNLTDVLTFTN